MSGLTRHIRLYAAVIGCLFVLSQPSGVAIAAPGASTCECQRVVDSGGQALKVSRGKQPILLVHGFGFPLGSGLLGNPGQWDGLAKKLGENYAVGRFNYSDLHANWVTDPGQNNEQSIADMLAAAIKCMAASSGKKLILVGHSMGGLAIQAALGGDAAENVAGIISIATPWQGVSKDRIEYLITASRLAALNMPPTVGLPINAYLDVLKSSSALRALEQGDDGQPSPELEKLPKIRPGIPVLPIAGVALTINSEDLRRHTIPDVHGGSGQTPLADLPLGQEVNLIGTTVTLFDKKRGATAISDAKSSEGIDPIVGAKSALAVKPRVTDESYVKESITVKCPGNLADCMLGYGAGTYHSALPSDPEVAKHVLPTIEEWTKSAGHASLAKATNASGGCIKPEPQVGPQSPPKPPIPRPAPAPVNKGQQGGAQQKPVKPPQDGQQKPPNEKLPAQAAPIPEPAPAPQRSDGPSQGSNTGNSPTAAIKLRINRVWTRNGGGADQSAFACGKQIRLSLELTNPNKTAVHANIAFLADNSSRSLYNHDQSVDIPPGVARYESPFTLPNDVNGEFDYTAIVTPASGTGLPKVQGSTSFSVGCGGL